MQRPLGQAKKGVGHFVFPLPGRAAEKRWVWKGNIKELIQHEERKTNYIYFAVFFKENYLPNHNLMDENIHCFSLFPVA